MATIPQKELRNNVGEAIWQTAPPRTLAGDFERFPAAFTGPFN
jgi:hypothetical protein